MRAPVIESRRGLIVDRVVTGVLCLGQVGLFFVAFLSFIALPMSTDNCAYVDCGDEDWIRYAMATVALTGPLGLVFLGVAAYLLSTRKVAFWAPLTGGIAQVVAIAIAWIMAGWAGPI
ncbi:hypothetical protein H7J88_04135 [Mycolicibacterium flavescens]|uniref:Transmembrane protein n=1 Tax=Mycolicibacterium flavescens TaxID=1776 RepID=A0A1E3RFE2_MYCFV|nr:hypothetical protein [Mycolicibacterium flavescens]MCV7278835.1 hypothetical protein [Mycolicibacterium flavescens]ODQ88573.1 hypothetical protein BHQ18_19070 [Mycolicibacterium flavescens]